jgi:hypothetical protein
MATFGNTSEGTQTFWRSANYLQGIKATSGAAGTISKLSVYAYEDYSGTLKVKGIIVDEDGYIIENGISQETAIPSSVGWTDLVFSTPPTVAAGTVYYLCVICDSGSSNFAIMYETGDADSCGDVNNYATPTDPYDSWITNSTYKTSIYATYTSVPNEVGPFPTHFNT